jgi:putative ABC transport system permease protein
LFALAFSTVLGIFGGLYPAVWAMRMMPMDAIRRG